MAPQDTLQHVQVVSSQSPMGSLPLSSESWCIQGLVCALQAWSPCFPQWKSCSQIPLAFKVRFPGIPSPFVRSPGWEAWCGVQNLHNSGRTSLVLLFSGLWVTHLVGMGFDFIMTVLLLPSHCGFLFGLGHGVSFLGWVSVSSCWWLSNSWLQIWSSCRRRWAHILLLHHLELEALYLFIFNFYCHIVTLQCCVSFWASLVAQMVKNLPEMQETWVRSLDWEDPLEKGMATHSSVLAWSTPWTEEPGGLQSMGSQRVGHDWATKHASMANTFSLCALG